MNIATHLLGDILVSMEIISRDQLNQALELQSYFTENKQALAGAGNSKLLSETKIPKLGEILLGKSFISGEQLSTALQIQTKRVKDLSSLDSKKLATALELGFLINSTVDLEEVLSLIMKYANLVTASMASTLMLYDEKTGELVFSIPTGPKAKEIQDIRIPPGAGIAGWVARHQEYVLVKDIKKDPRFYPGIDTITGGETKSLLCVPMKSKTGIIGVLEVMNKNNSSYFTENDALLLSIFAQQSAIAIENARLFITLEKHLKEEQSIKEELAKTERLHAVGTLAGGIAHDFNNLLSGIFGYLDLALQTTKDKSVKEYLEKAFTASERAKGLTRQLLTFSKGGAPIKKVEALAGFIRETTNFALSGSNVFCDFQLPEDLWMCNCDKNQVGQVIENIVINANQAMPSGGTIRVSAFNITLKSNDHVLLDAGNYIKICISDTGVGIPKQLISRIFDPFFTTKPKGSGIGLAASYSIVKRHGGIIEVESEERKGTCFNIFIPATGQPGKEDKKKTSKAYQGVGRILIMDDDDIIQKILTHMFSAMGFTAVSANEGRKAVELFQKAADQGSRFAAVVLDLTVPGGMGGKETVKEIRKIDKETPIFVASGYSEDAVIAKPEKFGFTASIKKPFSMTQISQLLHTYL